MPSSLGSRLWGDNVTTVRHISFPRQSIPDELVAVGSLGAWIGEACAGGDPVGEHLRVEGAAEVGADFEFLELSGSRVKGCSFASCDFHRAIFTDVAFENCDFSNARFAEANFTRCSFASCKMTGADFSEAVLTFVDVRDSSFAYASFERARLRDVRLRATDCASAYFAEADQKRLVLDDVRLSGANLFRMSLAGVDLATCRIDGIVFSDAMGEVRGCTMDLYQAAGIAQRLGVTIAD